MKIKIGPYPHWWTTRNFEEWCHCKIHGKEFSLIEKSVDESEYNKLDHAIDWFCDKWQIVLNHTVNRIGQKRKIKIHIDPYDVWNMNHTLSLIILPMLEMLKAHKHGSPFVDQEDVPEHLRATEKAGPENGYTDNTVHDRWAWILDEMIWTFQQLADEDADRQFHSGEHDIIWEKVEREYGTGFVMKKGPNDTHVFDKEGYDAWNKRIDNGLRLFAKYYQGLWD